MREGPLVRTGLNLDGGIPVLPVGARRDQLQREHQRLREGPVMRTCPGPDAGVAALPPGGERDELQVSLR